MSGDSPLKYFYSINVFFNVRIINNRSKINNRTDINFIQLNQKFRIIRFKYFEQVKPSNISKMNFSFDMFIPFKIRSNS